ncbi:hypothetical protein RMSM_03176 [Rhodopirellula maiorica SM1]|uniref:Uncharacterized protein n=1 Tax=Rhodopirellula maiorica SM1 TaxID=1265738 RepID=M5RWX0_9BACT|nr:hypothetical protein RMSM_03176 [Rhodopirellula maiorica SM1]
MSNVVKAERIPCRDADGFVCASKISMLHAVAIILNTHRQLNMVGEGSVGDQLQIVD